MRRIHIALGTRDLEAAVADYTHRLGRPPEVVVPGEYALWRTDEVNLSVRVDPDSAPGALRHLGFEDDDADGFTADTDCHGIVWERFAAEHQAAEIDAIWPNAQRAVAGAED